jgi:hypothetical protein
VVVDDVKDNDRSYGNEIDPTFDELRNWIVIWNENEPPIPTQHNRELAGPRTSQQVATVWRAAWNVRQRWLAAV